jgi:hypothetical protein
MIDMETFRDFDRWRLELTTTGAYECKLYRDEWAPWNPYAWGLGDTMELAVERALGWAKDRESKIVDKLYPKY